ncbi:MAG: hypothetical protein J5739_09525 [Lachnospiraceae bacterium]|nr:hypothetical protein [Lachnospiraceae bacterium]
MPSVRETVLNLTTRIIEKKEPCHIVLSQALGKSGDLQEKDRALIKLLVYGVVERRLMLDRIIEELSGRPINKLKPVVRNILRIGIYQLAFTDIPDHAAVFETVALAKKGPASPFKAFVNANLRSFQRRKDFFMREFAADLPEDERLSYEFSMPLWITHMWQQSYGPAETGRILRAFLEPHGIPIRINISKASEQEVIAALEARGIRAEKSGLCDNAYILYDCPAPTLISEFNDGLFTVQDGACALSGQMLGLRGGEKVLDLCAAPGGKTLNAADILRYRESKAGSNDSERILLQSSNHPAREETEEAVQSAEVTRGHVTACDISKEKTDLIVDSVRRCGFDNISVTVNDATVRYESFVDAFDVVICDLPCSGLGIIGKKPDIKYNASPEGIAELAELQREILTNAFDYVRKGGKLLFSTCTLTEEENEVNTEFIEKSGMFELKEKKTVMPGTFGADGFYMSLFIKKSEAFIDETRPGYLDV